LRVRSTLADNGHIKVLFRLPRPALTGIGN